MSESNQSLTVSVRSLRPDAQLPKYQSAFASGCDVHASLETTVTVAPGERVRIPTGLAVEIPEGFEIQVRPRSGLAWRDGLTVLNSPGTIDADYRGEVQVLLVNLGKESVQIQPGDRIAQFCVQRALQVTWKAVDELGATARGEGGFGSTGKSL